MSVVVPIDSFEESILDYLFEIKEEVSDKTYIDLSNITKQCYDEGIPSKVKVLSYIKSHKNDIPPDVYSGILNLLYTYDHNNNSFIKRLCSPVYILNEIVNEHSQTIIDKVILYFYSLVVLLVFVLIRIPITVLLIIISILNYILVYLCTNPKFISFIIIILMVLPAGTIMIINLIRDNH